MLSTNARFRASWWNEVVTELLKALRVRMTVDGAWDRVASFAIFSVSLEVFWDMSMIFSLMPSN